MPVSSSRYSAPSFWGNVAVLARVSEARMNAAPDVVAARRIHDEAIAGGPEVARGTDRASWRNAIVLKCTAARPVRCYDMRLHAVVPYVARTSSFAHGVRIVGEKSLEPGPDDRAAEVQDLLAAREHADDLASWDPYAAGRLHEILDRCDGSRASRGGRLLNSIRGATDSVRRLALRGWIALQGRRLFLM